MVHIEHDFIVPEQQTLIIQYIMVLKISTKKFSSNPDAVFTHHKQQLKR